MRLICPNCDAQYEIADNVIPKEGRDVQCSNCSTTWFQEAMPAEPAPNVAEAVAGLMAEAAATEETADPAGTWQDDGMVEDVAPEAPPVPKPVAAQDFDDGVQDAYDDGDEPDEDDLDEAAFEGAPQSTVSEESAAILREEAMRELKARLAEASTLEHQEDLGLEEAAAEPRVVDPVPVPVPVPMPVPGREEGRGVSRDAATAEAVADTLGRARGRLPDIEEVNTSLAPVTRAQEDHTAGRAAVEEPKPRRGGFRFGFVLALLLTGAGVGAYAFAPAIEAQVPQAAPTLDDFVMRVDDLRIWWDVFARDTIAGFQLMIEDLLG